jgi:hypothetical protein
MGTNFTGAWRSGGLGVPPRVRADGAPTATIGACHGSDDTGSVVPGGLPEQSRTNRRQVGHRKYRREFGITTNTG